MRPDNEPKILVVIVSYNSAAEMPDCISKLRASESVSCDIVVVDNSSSDDSAGISERLGITTIRLPSNVGYASAINEALLQSATDTEWIVAMNPDVLVDRDTFATLLTTGEPDERIGLIGPNIFRIQDDTEPERSREAYPSGRRYLSVCLAFRRAASACVRRSKHSDDLYHLAAKPQDRASDVDWISGCCMFIRRRALTACGGLNERYFLYFEDMSLGFRMRNSGLRVVFEPRASVSHLHGRSRRSRRVRSHLSHIRSAVRFWNSEFGWRCEPAVARGT